VRDQRALRDDDATVPQLEAGSEASWFLSQLWRRPVVDVRAIERLGQVADVVCDAATRRVLGVRIEHETQEHPVMEAARRALTGASGATYISAAQIIALHGDVVTVDPQRAAETPERLEGYPHLSHVQGFAVLTIAGKRLGRLVDIRVDATGRHILSYVVQPGGHGVARSDVSLRPRRLYAWHQALLSGEESVGPPAAREHADTADHPVLTIPATHEVRVGRDLIIVADPAETEAERGATTTPGADHQTEPLAPEE
jgi:sporulation protein YlmC with PRC-barrel domain